MSVPARRIAAPGSATDCDSAEAVAKQAEPAGERKTSDKTAVNFADLVADPEAAKKPLAERETTVTKDGMVVFK